VDFVSQDYVYVYTVKPVKIERRQLFELVLVPAEFLYHCISLPTDYSNPYYRNSQTQSVVPSYLKACSSQPILQTIVAIKLANFEPVFHTFTF